MKKPELVIMAAGMGSRYGGLKQMEPLGANGELIIDYSIYDALRAGFEKIVFIIKKEIEQDFKNIIGRRIEKRADVAYAFQELSMLPGGRRIPEGRVKPWGTAHALICAKGCIDAPFAVVNADDYYGPAAYQTLYDWLVQPRMADGKAHFSMIGYHLENTLSMSGGVTRGVCEADDKGCLKRITECRMIEPAPGGARYPKKDGTFGEIPNGTIVSMNIWGLTPGFLDLAERDFPSFLDKNVPVNPQKCEYLLPEEIDALLHTGEADVQVLHSKDVWYGVTYPEDKAAVQAALAGMAEEELYSTPLWS
jgi:NDP-sugar pyrophosphorylase family protein